MSFSKGNLREIFVCSQCHQEMSNKEMLQMHIQNVHSKGVFATVKQKIKGLKSDPTKIYAQYFLMNNYKTDLTVGYMGQYSDYFARIRNEKNEQIRMLTKQMLLRVELLTKTNEMIPKNGSTKERFKYEQDIVPWMEDSVAKVCASCAKSFGLFRGKHHCRLDGSVICNQCSRFLPFSTAYWLVELNSTSLSKLNEVECLRLNNLLQVTTTMIVNDGTNEEYLRICSFCAQFLQKFYDKIRFRNIQKDQALIQYDKLIEIQHYCFQNQPIYLKIVNSLLNGETVYEMNDALHLYQQLNSTYDKIDSISRMIAKIGETTKTDDKRYVGFCRNIRTYAVLLIQMYSKSTVRVPSKDEIRRISEQRSPSSPPPPSTLGSKISSPQQSFGRIQFVKQSESTTGENDDAIFLDLN